MKNNTSKFWGVLDNALVSFLPQKAQFEILKSFLSKKKYSLAFYSLEDEYTYMNNSSLLKKLYEKPKVSGFIFFSLLQISYGKNQNIELIKKILSKNYEVLFYRENIHLKNLKSFKKDKKKLILFRNLNIDLIKKQQSLIN
tara:strand:- start:25 stop:447 length:423 start_codon:yes stop_codon:yes gene_type:complete